MDLKSVVKNVFYKSIKYEASTIHLQSSSKNFNFIVVNTKENFQLYFNNVTPYQT